MRRLPLPRAPRPRCRGRCEWFTFQRRDRVAGNLSLLPAFDLVETGAKRIVNQLFEGLRLLQTLDSNRNVSLECDGSAHTLSVTLHDVRANPALRRRAIARHITNNIPASTSSSG